MESIINEIKMKAATMEVYAEILDILANRVKWYQHPETIVNEETGEETETGRMLDDEGEYAAAHLRAYREAIKAVKKLAGV
jgi:hypothetical protein